MDSATPPLLAACEVAEASGGSGRGPLAMTAVSATTTADLAVSAADPVEAATQGLVSGEEALETLAGLFPLTRTTGVDKGAGSADLPLEAAALVLFSPFKMVLPLEAASLVPFSPFKLALPLEAATLGALAEDDEAGTACGTMADSSS
mmetsp:Transcript_101390/g.290913  ORF Transcript_101390/g.290913 Transcript_101390/m.290913 type:complete len:148 (-) Transcript_101390:1167-1610(-)